MPGELFVILGAETIILASIAAMTRYAKRMDVLRGRSVEQSVVSLKGSRHPPRSIRRKSRDLLRLIGRWRDLTMFAPLSLVRRPDITGTPRLGLQTRPQIWSRLVMSFRGPGPPNAEASGQAVPSEAGSSADVHG